MTPLSSLHQKSYRSPKVNAERRLFTFHEVEAWQRDNEYLVGKYRSTSGSYRESLKSLLYLHNQTGNIYSHLIGAVSFFAYAFFTYGTISTRYPTADARDILAFGIFIGGAVICFGISATFHVFGNHSSHVYHTWLAMDLYGIFVLIVGTVYSGTYYGFYCEPQYWAIYSVGLPLLTDTTKITIIVIGAGALCYLPRFRTPKWRWARATLFCAIGWSGAFPMTHAAQTLGIEQADKQMGWWYFIIEGLWYISGVTIYATRLPERLRPGWFDMWGGSHQIFHLCAVSGAAWHLVGLLKAFDYNHDPRTRMC
ncbi:hemolysin III family channel protein [Corynespora cassiicola Philippines]|uniref:Hemolysin III family channel protein n=1 Tax=Corynespora cassiicola Philippines TaxID=1448308 RepID=A0A2T2P965_CORCC|nr:hemolysin III family channel protein [Corynespora cassiicola Philippines]